MLNLQHRMCTGWKDYQTRKLCVLQALDLSGFPHHRFTLFPCTRGVHTSTTRIQICIPTALNEVSNMVLEKDGQDQLE